MPYSRCPIYVFDSASIDLSSDLSYYALVFVFPIPCLQLRFSVCVCVSVFQKGNGVFTINGNWFELLLGWHISVALFLSPISICTFFVFNHGKFQKTKNNTLGYCLVGRKMDFPENGFLIFWCLAQLRMENYFPRKMIFFPMEENDFLLEMMRT